MPVAILVEIHTSNVNVSISSCCLANLKLTASKSNSVVHSIVAGSFYKTWFSSSVFSPQSSVVSGELSFADLHWDESHFWEWDCDTWVAHSLYTPRLWYELAVDRGRMPKTTSRRFPDSLRLNLKIVLFISDKSLCSKHIKFKK